MYRSYASCVFVGDWFRCVPTDSGQMVALQAGNVAWLSQLLAPAIGRGVSRVLMPSQDMPTYSRQLDDTQLFRLYGTSPAEAWIGCFDSDAALDRFASLYDSLDPSDLVVGFEIPPVMRRAFASRGIDYLSLHNHPIRFLKDLTFGAYSNSPGIVSSLAACSCPKREIELQVARMSARFARLDPVQTRLPDGCPLVFGQTPLDASLISEGRLAVLEDHQEILSELLKDNAQVAFVRHPSADWPRKTIEFLRTRLGKTVLCIAGNNYPLIMSGRPLGQLVTLSSSIGVEAREFGYDVHFCLADPRAKFAVGGLDNEVQIMLDHRLFETALWENLLGGSGEGIEERGSAFHLGGNFIRSTLESWSFIDLEGPNPFVGMKKIIVPSCSANQTDLDTLAGELAGTSSQNFADAVAKAANSGIDLQIAAAPLNLGQEWEWRPDLPLADIALVNGFYALEEGGVWLGENIGEIEAPIGANAPARLQVSGYVGFSFFSGIMEKYPVVLLYVNGTPCAAMMAGDDPEPYRQLKFAAEISGTVTCELRLSCSHSASPADLRIGRDPRILGLILHEIRIKAEPVSGTVEHASLKIWGIGEQPIVITDIEER